MNHNYTVVQTIAQALQRLPTPLFYFSYDLLVFVILGICNMGEYVAIKCSVIQCLLSLSGRENFHSIYKI